jgi:hypothetical protein
VTTRRSFLLSFRLSLLLWRRFSLLARWRLDFGNGQRRAACFDFVAVRILCCLGVGRAGCTAATATTRWASTFAHADGSMKKVMLIRRSPKLLAELRASEKEPRICVTGKHLPRRGCTIGTDGARGTSRDPGDAGATARPGPCNLRPQPLDLSLRGSSRSCRRTPRVSPFPRPGATLEKLQTGPALRLRRFPQAVVGIN